MRNLFFCLCFIIVMQNCTSERNEDDLDSSSQKLVIDSSLNEEYRSYYGFVVKNSTQHNFYCLDKKVMLKYISNREIDSTSMKMDLLKSTWFSPLSGASYDYFVWINFIDSKLLTNTIDITVCNAKSKSLIIPVYVTQFNRNVENTKSKVSSCNNLFPSGIYKQMNLNLVYIIPLSYGMANEYLNIYDTLSRDLYKTFVQSKVH